MFSTSRRSGSRTASTAQRVDGGVRRRRQVGCPRRTRRCKRSLSRRRGFQVGHGDQAGCSRGVPAKRNTLLRQPCGPESARAAQALAAELSQDAGWAGSRWTSGRGPGRETRRWCVWGEESRGERRTGWWSWRLDDARTRPPRAGSGRRSLFILSSVRRYFL